MSDGHGCDAGGHHCGGDSWAAGGGEFGYSLGPDGRTPVPNIKRLTINGAPVTETAHEYVVGKRDAGRVGNDR